MDGWIKLHRQFLSWEWFDTSEMVKLFIYLLLSSNHSDNTWKGIVIKRGQVLTGLNSLSNNTKISIQTLRTCLKRLEKTGEINMQVTNKYRLITICNYDSYQDNQQATNKQPNKQLTSNQQTTNSKQEGKELKNEKNIGKHDVFFEKVYFDKSTELDEAFKDYLRLRIKHKYTMTERAINGLVNKLRECSNGNVREAIKTVDSAIIGKWKSFYNSDK
ncbi:unnamed protein product [marine sediment metagenome]|uniref:Uncharacterized protein n=1 Tax=marine sediment metagenome TaxID=412755 RepID=X1B6M6_9ZZZZ